MTPMYRRIELINPPRVEDEISIPAHKTGLMGAGPNELWEAWVDDLVGPVGVARQVHHRLVNSLEHLQRDVSGEAVADDDVCFALGDVDALDVADEVDAAQLL